MRIGYVKTHGTVYIISDTGIVWNQQGKRIKPASGEGLDALYSFYTGCIGIHTKYPLRALIEAAFDHHKVDPKYSMSEVIDKHMMKTKNIRK